MAISKYKIIQLLFFIALLLYMWFAPSSNEKNCLHSRNVKNFSYKGVITDKYVDTNNHSYPILIVDESTEIDLTNEISGLFDYIRISDKIEKKSGSYKFIITRDNKQTSYILNYGCDESNK